MSQQTASIVAADPHSDELTPQEERIAAWVASPFTCLDDETKRETADAFAESLGIDRATMYRAARREKVQLRANELIAQVLGIEAVPALWASILKRAIDDPEGFGWDVAKRLLDKDIHPFGNPSPEGGGPVTLEVPESMEMVLGMRKRRDDG